MQTDQHWPWEPKTYRFIYICNCKDKNLLISFIINCYQNHHRCLLIQQVSYFALCIYRFGSLRYSHIKNPILVLFNVGSDYKSQMTSQNFKTRNISKRCEMYLHWVRNQVRGVTKASFHTVLHPGGGTGGWIIVHILVLGCGKREK